MSTTLIVFVTACYLVTAILQFAQMNTGFGIMWFAYALANVGIIIAGGTK